MFCVRCLVNLIITFWSHIFLHTNNYFSSFGVGVSNSSSKRMKTRKGVPELQGPVLDCMSAIDKKSAWYFANITVLVFLMDIIPIVQAIIKEKTKETSKYISSSNFASILGQCRRPLLVQCRQIFHDVGPTLLRHWVCCILGGNTPANTYHLHNTVSMFAQRLWRWSDI